MTYPLLLEHGPKDLLSLYTNDYVKKKYDLEHSTFKEISKEEAIEIIKKDDGEKNNIQLVIDNHLYTLGDGGKYGATRDFKVSSEKQYVTKNGRATQDTADMPESHLLKIADKIYLVDLVKKDPDVVKARKDYNDEIRDATLYDDDYSFAKYQYFDIRDHNYYHDSPAVWRTSPNNILHHTPIRKITNDFYSKYINDAKEQIAKIDEKIALMQDALQTATDPEQRATLQSRIDFLTDERQAYVNDLETLYKKAKRDIGRTKDVRALVRNALSKKDIQTRIMSKINQLSELQDLDHKIQLALNKIEEIKKLGAPETQQLRRDVQKTEKQIRDLKKETAKLTFVVDNTDDFDADKLAKTQAQQKEYEDQLETYREFIDRFNKIAGKRGVQESVLNEHGPKDLFKAYQATNLRKFTQWDLEHSKFDAVSKEGALKLIKAHHAQNLQLVIGDKVVLVDEDGKATNVIYLYDNDKMYTKKSGKSEVDVRRMPASHLIKIADKIYHAKIVYKDEEQQQNRRDNSNIFSAGARWSTQSNSRRGYSNPYQYPDSRYFMVAELQDDPNKSLYNVSIKDKASELLSKKKHTPKEILKLIDDTTTKIKNIKKELSTTTDPEVQNNLKRKLSDTEYVLELYNDDLKDTYARLKSLTNIGKDVQAALRYAPSANKLQTDINTKKETLAEIHNLKKQISDTANEIEDIKRLGSPEVREMHDRIVSTEKMINSKIADLNELEQKLSNTSEQDAAAVEAAVDEYNKLVKDAGEAAVTLNKLKAIKARRGG